MWHAIRRQSHPSERRKTKVMFLLCVNEILESKTANTQPRSIKLTPINYLPISLIIPSILAFRPLHHHASLCPHQTASSATASKFLYVSSGMAKVWSTNNWPIPKWLKLLSFYQRRAGFGLVPTVFRQGIDNALLSVTLDWATTSQSVLIRATSHFPQCPQHLASHRTFGHLTRKCRQLDAFSRGAAAVGMARGTYSCVKSLAVVRRGWKSANTHYTILQETRRVEMMSLNELRLITHSLPSFCTS